MKTNKTDSMLSQRVKQVKPSPTLVITAKALALKAAGRDVISLSAGEPDFDTPEHIRDAAIIAIHAGQTRYTAVDGTTALKKAIIDKFSRENNLHYEATQILVSAGAKHSLYNLMQATLNPDDEVIIPAPYWVSYPDMAILAGAKPIILETNATQHYKITPNQLNRAINAKTKLFIINSPSNPSGMAYSADELKALANVLLKHPHVLIVTDDIYEHIVWTQGSFKNIVNVCPELHNRTIVVNGVSKAYAMTGWRIGYAAGPDMIINAMKKIQSQSTSNACSIAQAAACEALSGDQSCLIPMVRAFKERHDFVTATVNAIPGLQCAPNDGTFYVFINAEKAIERSKDLANDLDLSEFLLTKALVATVPGSAFGSPGCIRLSYAASLERLKEALSRIKDVLK